MTRITVSYGTEAEEYPVLMNDGAYYVSASTRWDPGYSQAPTFRIHAYDAAGKPVDVFDVPPSRSSGLGPGAPTPSSSGDG